MAGLLKLNRSTLYYRSRRDPQDALRARLRELAASRVRFGYRRLTVMLRREGWPVNTKRVYRLYRLDGLAVRTKVRKKIARRTRMPLVRVLTVVDQFTRECLLLLADSSLTGQKVATALSLIVAQRGAPVSITVDNELSQKARAGSEHTPAMARKASKVGYDSAIIEASMHRGGSLRVGAPSKVRSPSSPADAALDRRRHYG